MNALFPKAVDRDPLDFNRTPAWCVKLLVPYLGQPQTILDAGCGDGAIGKVLRRVFPRAFVTGVELHELRARMALETKAYDSIGRFDWTRAYDAWERGKPYLDIIISNPPFGLAALDFLRCALARVRPGGTVAFLLPTHWHQDCDAKTEYARQRLLDSIRLPDGREGYCKLDIVGGGSNPCRPSFRGGGATASDRYAWFMFGEPWAGQPSRRIHAILPAVESGQQVLL